MRMLGFEEGVVVDTSDPQQMGRLKIWVPSIDGDIYEVEQLPWATYVSPLAGQTRDYPAGAEGGIGPGLLSYGLWAVPKAGAVVIVGFLHNDPNRRIYVGSYFRDCGNRSLPAGRMRPDVADAPVSDTYEPIEPTSANLKTQFNGKLTAPEAQSRGVYERSVAQDKTTKDGEEGYQVNVSVPKDEKGQTQFDPQTYTLTTPGRHSLIFQDNPENGRARLKTASGHQIILDDANERIYVSTAHGKSWIELDQDGRIHVYAADSISMSTGKDFNFTVAGDINMQAGGDVNVQAGKSAKIAACAAINLSGAGVNIESSAKFNILSAGTLLQTAPDIHLNGPTAGSADCPSTPQIIPTHEPWPRAASSSTRGKHWRP